LNNQPKDNHASRKDHQAKKLVSYLTLPEKTCSQAR